VTWVIHRASKRWHPHKQNSIRAGKKSLRQRFHILRWFMDEINNDLRPIEKRMTEKEIAEQLTEEEEI